MIPEWSSQGVLPPIRPGKPGHDADRSPYRANLESIIERFSKSKERIKILEGLLDYRKALHDAGIVNGFQWLDGSFMEQIEKLESRPPNDIDVVTFFHLPDGMTQAMMMNEHGGMFNTEHMKTQYHVDGYPFVLGEATVAFNVKMISYWYSMWSHRRSGLWKGFVQINLSPDEDIVARSRLALVLQEGALT